VLDDLLNVAFGRLVTSDDDLANQHVDRMLAEARISHAPACR